MSKKSLLINSRFFFITSILFYNSISEIYAQQKVQFTQYMFNELIINPAFAGNDGALSVTLVDRSQWISVEGAPNTQTLSAHTFFKNKNVGAGVSFVNDRIGVHKTQNFQGDVAYRLSFSKRNYLSMGLRAGVGLRNSDYASIAGNSPDPLLANSNFTNTSLTLGAGLYYSTPKFQLGISVPDLIPEKINISDSTSIEWRKAQYFVFARYQWALNNTLDFAPSVLIKYLHDLPVSYDINASVIIKKVLTMGLSYRKKESLSFLLKAKFTQQLQLGYAYDMVIGKVSSTSSGSHEFMLNYIFRFKKNNIVSPR